MIFTEVVTNVQEQFFNLGFKRECQKIALIPGTFVYVMYSNSIRILFRQKKSKRDSVYDSPLYENRSALAGTGPCPPRLSDRARLALCMLPSELGLPLLRQQQQQLHRSWHGSVRQLGLIMLLLALMWFVRLYLHYCSQWLFLQAIAVPVNK